MNFTDPIHSPASCEACLIGAHTVYGTRSKKQSVDVTRLRTRQITVRANSTIFRKGERPQTVYTLYEGWAYKYKQLRDGSRQILMVYIPGDLVLAQAMSGQPLPFAIKAATKATLCAFPCEAFFKTMMGSADLRPGLGAYMFASHNDTEELLTAIGRRSASSRVARFVLSLERRLSARGLASDGRFQMPLSQKLIADALGLTHIYVNRVVSTFRREKILEWTRGEMIVTDREALRDLADTG